MVDISVENYKDSFVYRITVRNKEMFWVRMKEVQNGLGIKNMPDLVGKEIHDIYGTKNPKEEQIRRYKSSEKELVKDSKYNFKYIRSDIIKMRI